MRHLAPVGSFLLLVAALFLIWNHRFERTPDVPTCRLTDLRKMASPTPGVEWLGPESDPHVRLDAGSPASPVVTRIGFPAMPAVDFLRVRFQLKAGNLTPGREIWQDGRCIVEWFPSGGGPSENDPVGSIRQNDQGGVANFVIRPANAPAHPALRLENLGLSGEFELTMFEATVVRETWIWKIGRWLLLAGWFFWSYDAVVRLGGKSGARSFLAAMVCLVMAIYCVVPGPWKNLRPFGDEFNIGTEILTQAPPDSTGPLLPRESAGAATQTPVISAGDIPLKGDITLRIKFQLVKLRPLLHALLFLAPAALIALLAGKRAGLSLALLLAVAMEAAEAGFGYGFDTGDVWDLTWDSIGIATGLILSEMLSRWHAARASHFSQSPAPTVGDGSY